MEQLEREPAFSMYHEPKVPFCFIWLYTSFIELYSHSGESITWTDIENYAKLRNIKFTQIELDYIIRMSTWTNEQIKEMKSEQE